MAKDLLSAVTKQKDKDISRPSFGLCKEVPGLTYIVHVLTYLLFFLFHR